MSVHCQCLDPSEKMQQENLVSNIYTKILRNNNLTYKATKHNIQTKDLDKIIILAID